MIDLKEIDYREYDDFDILSFIKGITNLKEIGVNYQCRIMQNLNIQQITNRINGDFDRSINGDFMLD